MTTSPTAQKKPKATGSTPGIDAMIDAQHAPEQARQWHRLFKEIYRHQLVQRPLPPEDQYGALRSAWQLFEQHRAEQIELRVYNPQRGSDGWQCEHSVIELVMDDQPFIVASCLTELARQGIRVHHQAYPMMDVRRDAEGRLLDLYPDDTTGTIRETLVRFEIDRQPDTEALDTLRQSLLHVLNDVHATVCDWKPMMLRLEEAATECEQAGDADAEIVTFLRWLADDNFLFIGYRYYEIATDSRGDLQLHYRDGSGLGCFRDPITESQRLIQLDATQSALLRSPERLVLTRSTTRSTVQQGRYLDYIGVKHKDTEGRLIGESRFFGLYSSKAYDAPLTHIPLIRTNIRRLLESSELPSNSHAYKALRHLLFTYPRDEMLQTRYEELKEIIYGMLDCVERRSLGLFLRTDAHGRYIRALMLIPRDQYHTQLRQKTEQILMQALNGHSAEFSVRLTEDPLALIEFCIYSHNALQVQYNREALQQQIIDAAESWHDRLHQQLLEQLSEVQANALFARYAQRLPLAYRDATPPATAVEDLAQLASLGVDNSLTTRLAPLAAGHLSLRVLGCGGDMTLSDVLPILEHLGVSVLSATPYQLSPEKGQLPGWIIDFQLACDPQLDLEPQAVREQFQQSFIRTYNGELEDDRFHQLVLRAGLSYRDITLLRAVSKYLQQLGVPFSQHYIEQALSRNPQLTRQLCELFAIRFAPDFDGDRQASEERLSQAMLIALDAVENLDEDRILRHYLSVIQAMLRTNCYQRIDGREKGYLSFKLNTRALSFAPEPRPAFEIFVYAPWVEGVHLRAGPVARGGLRWSDRREDFRTEVLGLVKAQMVKNAVIVPVGAKGGFVAKQLPEGGDRQAIQNEVIHCYETFIRGLLDITDNRIGDEIVTPDLVVRHDAPDPYLVVAADKGTATFSDIANRISGEYGFWLGDAFASGGSNGYDHKKMGITARGAWESVKRLFREQNVDCQNQDFTAIGIGDMAGDVFGNGMLLSKHIRLVAAFNHQHIFIDPNPDAASSWQERKRLFDLPRSSWEDYDLSLISHGGGLYKRSAKRIELSPEARAALGTEQTRFTPNELIRVILQAPVDLLWNGGIGTYVKASGETHDQVGDRSNDALRVDASELRVKLIGEGGNLGLTQRARIEYARAGGRINTDAIDNSGGVDSSDHEVNLKILLNQPLADGSLDQAARNSLLESMTDDVARLVLRHNYGQSQILSLDERQSPSRINDHRRLIQLLEKEGRLNRELEQLPGDDALDLLSREGQGLSRPEIAVLLAHSKLWLCDRLIAEGLAEDESLAKQLPEYFPEAIRQRYTDALAHHPLRAELLATHLTNRLCNRMGETFVSYLQSETNCRAIDAVHAFETSNRIFDIDNLWTQLEALEYRIPDDLFRDQLSTIQDLLERTALWLARQPRHELSDQEQVDAFATEISRLIEHLPELLDTEELEQQQLLRDRLAAAGTPAALAARLATLGYQYPLLAVARLSRNRGESSPVTAALHFALEQRLQLKALRHRIAALPERDLWQRKARAALAREVDDYQLQLCHWILDTTAADAEPGQRLDQWQQGVAQQLNNLEQILSEVRVNESPDLAMLSVAVRKLGSLQPL
ncbi:NAD-glutamate dehydrogenase [Marinobacterium zhoushanense]|uniref:NAD-glutamate dehydrogenase n=1 Tax=Marinobacterium zhoushanense TaxID=1679163 RepID=A0ABQ1K583_9GAMM|nr:NAD-glutamate dehydrogenase [Marinobacterium zhoushanense]GGB87949.1 NAD-glutamate dehydrogenase [Marinobacterium zhoushanense]